MTQLKSAQLSISQLDSSPRILIFNNAVGGHHPGYLKLLVDYWCTHKLIGHLFLVVSPLLLPKHPDIVDLSVATAHNIHILTMLDEEYEEIARQKGYFKKVLKEWNIICRYVERLDIKHCFLPTLDHFMLLLAFDRRYECTFSGIYLRPTFHYREFENYIPSWQEKIRALRQRLLLSLVEKNSKLKALFCLDPLVVDYMKQRSQQTKLIYLPDPVKPIHYNSTRAKAFREKLAIPEHRKVFLLFGALSPRKGIYQVLQALQALTEEQQQQVCLLLVGSLADSEKPAIDAVIQTLPSVQLIARYDFITDTEVEDYFAVSDVVLATYQKHVGMSGILLLAAAIQKPVLGSNYGLMGELIRQYELGQAVDSTNPDSIATTISKFLANSPDQLSNPEKMKLFIDRHDARQFPALIFDLLCSCST